MCHFELYGKEHRHGALFVYKIFKGYRVVVDRNYDIIDIYYLYGGDFLKFQVLDRGYFNGTSRTFYLRRDNWDDYCYKTTFDTFYCDEKGELHGIGSLKIGYQGMPEGRVFDAIPKSFTELPKDFFSLGQNADYYEKIKSLASQHATEILVGLHDIAYDIERFEEVRHETVVKTSLLREVSAFTVKNQFYRIAHGGVRLTEYDFAYQSPKPRDEEGFSRIRLDFHVKPFSHPSSNIHVLIGRNGTGKTTLLKNMIQSFRNIGSKKEYGTFSYAESSNMSGDNQFANLLCVAFSPFDDFSQIVPNDLEIPYTYIGLDKEGGDLLEAICEQFWENFEACMGARQKKERWLEVVKKLQSDPTFRESQCERMVEVFDERGNSVRDRDCVMHMKEKIQKHFRRLSSGHKVILLAMTCCVNLMEEKSLVLIDEPENHLHPPLLSAFVNALSYLLRERNGVAIISTHSPVVLQEVPSSCVWKLRRTGREMVAERISVETFGASITTLTSEVFGLEVTESGFHKALRDAVAQGGSFREIAERFDHQLGNEARALLRILLMDVQDREDLS